MWYLQLPAEEILLRWVNYHLEKANSDLTISNFSSSIRNSLAYAHLLKQLAPTSELDIAALAVEDDLLARADSVLATARSIGCDKFVQPIDIVEGHERLNLAFVANLFNNYVRRRVDSKVPLSSLCRCIARNISANRE